MPEPLVTIIVPTFNRRRWIGECLDSISAQTYDHVEALVIDDCSTDATVEWLQSQPRYSFVKIHVQPRNGGASEARNRGIKIARGDLIAFIDSDDLLAPKHVEKAVEAFRESDSLGLFCCDSTIIGADGDVLYGGKTWHQIQSDLKRHPIDSGLRSLPDIFMFSNIFPGFTLRKEVFARIGNFDQTVFPMDDYDLMLRVAGCGYEVYYCHESLALRREHSGQCSGVANSVDTCRKQIRVLKMSLSRNPELMAARSQVRRRLAQATLELAVSRISAGERAGGLRNLLQAIVAHPSQAFKVARLGGRRFHRLVTTP